MICQKRSKGRFKGRKKISFKKAWHLAAIILLKLWD
jgi:hypothetical protein